MIQREPMDDALSEATERAERAEEEATAMAGEIEQLRPIAETAERIYKAALDTLQLPEGCADNPAEGLGCILAGLKMRTDDQQKEIERLRAEIDGYEGMKEGVAIRIADLEARLAANAGGKRGG